MIGSLYIYGANIIEDMSLEHIQNQPTDSEYNNIDSNLEPPLSRIELFNTNNNYISFQKNFTKTYKQSVEYELSDVVDYMIGSSSNMIFSNIIYVILKILLLYIVTAIILQSQSSIFFYLIKCVGAIFVYTLVSYGLIKLLYKDKSKINTSITKKTYMIFDNLSTIISKQMNENVMNLLLREIPNIAQETYYIRLDTYIYIIFSILYIMAHYIITKYTFSKTYASIVPLFIQELKWDIKNLSIEKLLNSGVERAGNMLAETIQQNMGEDNANDQLNPIPNFSANSPTMQIAKDDQINYVDYILLIIIGMILNYLIYKYIIQNILNNTHTESSNDTWNNNIDNAFKNMDLMIMTNNLNASMLSLQQEYAKVSKSTSNQYINTKQYAIIMGTILILLLFVYVVKYILNIEMIQRRIIPTNLSLLQTIISCPGILLLYINIIYTPMRHYKKWNSISQDVKNNIPKLLICQFDKIIPKKTYNLQIDSIKLKDLAIGYTIHNPILSCEYLSLNSCNIYCIIGPNGCGKSTILQSLIGYIPPNFSGNISFIDSNQKSYSINDISNYELRKSISYITVAAKIPRMPLRSLFQIYNPDITDSQIKILLEKCHVLECFVQSNIINADLLEEAFNKEVNMSVMSGGQVDRLNLALRISNPATKVWLLDEILDSSNISIALSIIKFITEEAQKHNKIVAIISHKGEDIMNDNMQYIIFDHNGNMTTNREMMIK